MHFASAKYIKILYLVLGASLPCLPRHPPIALRYLEAVLIASAESSEGEVAAPSISSNFLA